MATTQPDNIWSPDGSDPYELSLTLSTMADSIQDALTEKANYGVGTSAEMNAALDRFPNGAVWFNTTDNTEYRKDSGTWASPPKWQAGQATITVATGGTAGTTTVNFAPGRFSSPPSVVATLASGAGSDATSVVRVTNVTASSFLLVLSASSAGAKTLNWIASSLG